MVSSDTGKKVLAILLVLALAASAVWAYRTYTEPVYEREQVLTFSYTYGGYHTFTAYVSEDNPIYPIESGLSGMAGYYYAISPRATVAFDFSFTSTRDDASVSLTAETLLTISEVNDKGVPYWARSTVVTTAEATGAAPLLLHDSVVLDAASLDLEIQEIREALGVSAGRVGGLLTTTVFVEGTVGGMPVSATERYDIPLTFNGTYYTVVVEERDPVTQRFYAPQTVSRKKTITDIPLQAAAVVLSAIALVLVAFSMRKRTPQAADPEKYKDWISIGVYPSGTWDKEVYIPVLKDLVDIAIDSHKRVVYDSSKDVYFVIDGKVLYYLVIEQKGKGGKKKGQQAEQPKS